MIRHGIAEPRRGDDLAMGIGQRHRGAVALVHQDNLVEAVVIEIGAVGRAGFLFDGDGCAVETDDRFVVIEIFINGDHDHFAGPGDDDRFLGFSGRRFCCGGRRRWRWRIGFRDIGSVCRQL